MPVSRRSKQYKEFEALQTIYGHEHPIMLARLPIASTRRRELY